MEMRQNIHLADEVYKKSFIRVHIIASSRNTHLGSVGVRHMDADHFKISAEILQKNATKSSIRDLNAEFQMKGGNVIHKTSKHGSVFHLSHSDPRYLEEFRIRLFLELGLMKLEEAPEEFRKKPAPDPRYGESHQLRRGWNVRSQREKDQGIDDRQKYQPSFNRGSDRRPQPGQRQDYRRGPPPRQEKTEAPEPEEDANAKTFQERWEDLDVYMEIIDKALVEGAVDDGDIIRYAYQAEVDPVVIRSLKKVLWDSRCKGLREKCPFGKKKFRFEGLMKILSGKVDGYKRIDSPFSKFLKQWEKNIEGMYGPFREKKVEVEGKISSYKAVYRKDNEHLKILVYDTKMRIAGSDSEMSPTRKIWVKVKINELEKVQKGQQVHLEDIVSFRGKCIFDKHFNDYWVVDLEELKVLEGGPGDLITAVSS